MFGKKEKPEKKDGFIKRLRARIENSFRAEERTQELAVSEHKYRRIFEVSRDMILVTQTDGTIINLNPAGCKLLGYKEPEPSFSRK